MDNNLDIILLTALVSILYLAFAFTLFKVSRPGQQKI